MSKVHLTIIDKVNNMKISKKEFDLNNHLKTTWTILPKNASCDVKLKFSPAIAPSVINYKWHQTQELSTKNDGSVVMKFCVDSLSEITWWILKHSDQVEVIEPQALKNRIYSIAQNIITSNRLEPPQDDIMP